MTTKLLRRIDLIFQYGNPLIPMKVAYWARSQHFCLGVYWVSPKNNLVIILQPNCNNSMGRRRKRIFGRVGVTLSAILFVATVTKSICHDVVCE